MKEIQTPLPRFPAFYSTSCYVCHSSRCIIFGFALSSVILHTHCLSPSSNHVSRLHVSLRQFVLKGQAHNAAQRNQSAATHGDPCERRRPRPRDSSTRRGFKTALQGQEGQQLPLTTICHGDVPLWPFQRARLQCSCVGRKNVENPRCAAWLPQWTAERACERGSANNTRNTPPRTPPGYRSSNPSVDELSNTPPSLKAPSMTVLRPTLCKWASRTVYVRGTHIPEWTQHKGTGRACPFGRTARRSLRRLQIHNVAAQ